MIDAIDEASSDEEFDEDDLTNGAAGQALEGNIQELKKINKLQYQTFSLSKTIYALTQNTSSVLIVQFCQGPQQGCNCDQCRV